MTFNLLISECVAYYMCHGKYLQQIWTFWDLSIFSSCKQRQDEKWTN